MKLILFENKTGRRNARLKLEPQPPVSTETEHIPIGGVLVRIRKIDIPVGRIDRNAIRRGKHRSIRYKLFFYNLFRSNIQHFDGRLLRTIIIIVQIAERAADGEVGDSEIERLYHLIRLGVNTLEGHRHGSVIAV